MRDVIELPDMRELVPQSLSAEAFAPFGDVIVASSHSEQRLINEGNTTRFHNLAQLSLDDLGGRPGISIFRSTPLPAPVTLRFMERHPLSSQAFMPLSKNPYLVVVAPAGKLDESKVVAFIASGGQGVNYHPGTWHHYCLALGETSDFLVVDRIAEDENCDEVDLVQPIVVTYG